MESLDKNFLNLLCCPICNGDLEDKKTVLSCSKCKKEFKIKEGIPIFYE